MTRLFITLLLLLALAPIAGARTLVESRFSNVHVIIYTHVTLGTQVMVTADVENGVTPPRRIELNITSQLTANQLNQATTAFNFVLGQLGTQESVPTPTTTRTPTPVVTP